jgi:flagellar basal-body rod protein FlgC
MLSALDVSTSGLVAQRRRMLEVSQNIANMKSTRNEKGESVPYQPRSVVFQSEESESNPGVAKVTVSTVVPQNIEPIWRDEPGHPDAAKTGPHAGQVAYPNIDMMTEYTNALEAARSYEANLGAMDITKDMEKQTLRILA